MSGVRKESRNDSVAGSSTMMEPTMMEEGEEYFNTEEPSAEWTEPTACSQLCRMCATENEYLIPIFDGEGVEHQLGMKIEKHLPIRVHVDDTLPLQVCYQCASTLIAWHDLVVGCIEAEKKLRQLQHQGEPQEEDIEDVKTCDTAMFYEDPTGTEPANDPIDTEPSTSASTHVQIRLPPKKTVPKANPKLKMVIVKTPTPATVTAPTARMVTPKTEGALDTTERRRHGKTNATKISSGSASQFERKSHSTIPGKQHRLSPFLSGRRSSDTVVHKSFQEAEAVVVDVDPLAFPGYEFCQTPAAVSKQFATSPIALTKRQSLLRDHLTRDAIGQVLPLLTSKDSPAKRRPKRQWTASASKSCAKAPSSPPPSTSRSRLGVVPGQVRAGKTSALCEQAGRKPSEKQVRLGHACETCARTFRTKNTLENHVEVTHRDHSYKCDACAKEFQSAKRLRTHLANVHEKRPNKTFLCHLCGKSYDKRSSYFNHKLSHQPLPPATLTCDTCGRVFRQSTNLQRHLRTHTDERPYPCKVCGKAFRVSGTRNAHLRTHSKEKPFPCLVCAKAFGRSSHLRTHMRIHTGLTPYQCELCDEQFMYYNERVQHMMKLHGVAKADAGIKEKPC